MNAALTGPLGLSSTAILPLLAAPWIGSFLGVVIRRLPRQRPLVIARSACEHCGTFLGPSDLIPLLSFAFHRGRCRHCHHPISVFHPAIEVAALLIAAWVVYAAPDADLWIGCGLGWTLLTLAWIDSASLTLPDPLTLPLLAAGLIVTWLTQPTELTDHALAAIIAYTSFWTVAWLYRHLRGRDGLGGGDMKLLAAAGAWCGLAALPAIVFASACLGLLLALVIAVRDGTISSTRRIPFGPCIAAAFWLVWLYPLGMLPSLG